MFVPGPSFTEAQLREAAAASRSRVETLKALGLRPAGGNFKTLAKYLGRWEISISHFEPNAARARAGRLRGRPLAEILVEGSTYNRGALKQRLYAAGLKDPVCELCGQGDEWHGKRMSLILDHINGVATDNRLENLRIVCPNCNATLDTHCGRNLPRRAARVCERCEGTYRPSYSKQRFCSSTCAALATSVRRVERPPYEQLLAEIDATSYLAVGRRYGVSDNAIRKWVRTYEREVSAGGG